MKNFSIKESLERGWVLWKGNKKLLTLATIVLFIVGNLQIFRNSEDLGLISGIAWVLVAVAAVVFSFILQIGWWKILLKLERGETTRLGELVEHKNLFWRYTGLTFVMGLIIFAGFLLFIIPGIYFLLKYQFAPVILIDKNTSIRQALKESSAITEGIKMKVLALIIVLALLNVVGFFLFFVGVLVSVPVTNLALVHVYRKLSSPVLEPVAAQA